GYVDWDVNYPVNLRLYQDSIEKALSKLCQGKIELTYLTEHCAGFSTAIGSDAIPPYAKTINNPLLQMRLVGKKVWLSTEIVPLLEALATALVEIVEFAPLDGSLENSIDKMDIS